MRSQVLLRYRLGLPPAILVALLILQAWHVWGENIDDDVMLLDVNAALEEGDYERAFLLFEQLAQEGHAHAQYRTGVMFAIGQGVAPDTVQAVRWYLRAAEQEHQGAQYHLALHYQRGEGIAQNFLEAARWYRKAAELGDAGAQNSLGAMYTNGTGVPKDYVEAYAWFGIAAAQGNAKAERNGIFVAARLNRSQIDQANKKYREYWEEYVAPFQE